MSMNTRCLVVIFLSLGVLLIGGVKFKYIKYCGKKGNFLGIIKVKGTSE